MIPHRRPDGIVLGRCWSDDELDDVLRHVDLPRPVEGGQEPPHDPDAAAERVARARAHLRVVRTQPERLALAVDELGGALVDATAELQQAQGEGSDDADRADLLALTARAQLDAAWAIRGGGRAGTVGEDAFRLFHDGLLQADDTALRALRAAPAHPGAAVTRMHAARGLGVPADEAWARFALAVQVAPTLHPAHVAMLGHVSKKWYGSDEVMFDLARDASDKLPAGASATALFVHAHVEHEIDVFDDLKGKGRIATMRAFAKTQRLQKADAARATRVSDGLLALPADAVLTQPWLPEAHQCLAWFLRSTGEKGPRLVEHLRRSGRRIGRYPWLGLGDPFASALREAGLTG